MQCLMHDLSEGVGRGWKASFLYPCCSKMLESCKFAEWQVVALMLFCGWLRTELHFHLLSMKLKSVRQKVKKV